MRKFFSIPVSFWLVFAMLCIVEIRVNGQSQKTITLQGNVLDKKTGAPVEFATIVLSQTEQWAVADKDGKFIIRNIPVGKNTISISCLGYVTDNKEIVLSRDIDNYSVSLLQNDLTLDEVVVTAQDNSGSAATSRTIDKTALEHIQMVNVSDVSSLLPGGSTANPALTASQTLSIRAGSASEGGNASFGTAIEVDGVRINNNASFGNYQIGSGFKGATTNNIASSNVESIEVISGLPSVEYGDMGTGVVKINTKKGVTPWTFNLSTNPTMKQAAISKGFDLGSLRSGAAIGVLNASAEYTRAISDPRSPFTSYTRQGATLSYSNLFSSGIFANSPLRITAGLTGNIGGLDSSADPDSFKDTWTRSSDNALRANLSLNWLLSRSWITNLELNASASYSDKISKVREYDVYTAATVALHGIEEGYFIAEDYETNPNAAINLIPRGTHYNTMVTDDKPLTTKVALKANWARHFGNVNNKVKIGGDWTTDRNFGVGLYSEDMSNAETYRPYPYNLVPTMHNIAAYLEDNAVISIGKSRLNLVAGVRYDNSLIQGSIYDKTSSLSPRFNAKYTIFSPKDRRKNTVKELAIRASWGVAIKQPSYSILYPVPSYRDILCFTPTANSYGAAYPAYYIMPKRIEHNPNLIWQQNRQAEIGIETDIAGYKISITGFYNRTMHAYKLQTGYDVFSYRFTSTKDLATCSIPADNRLFAIDRQTGVVTVSDKTGELDPQTINGTIRHSLNPRTYADNATDPISRYGVEWIVDFKRIKSINTSIRWDGSFYGFRNIDKQSTAYSNYTNLSSDGTPFKYVGYFAGPAAITNGSEVRNLKTNVSINTNIPKVRMILTLRLEAGLLKYSRFLSEGNEGYTRTYALNERDNLLSFSGKDIYSGDLYVVSFPETYSSIDEPNVRKDYLKDLKWAKENDQDMYNDLSRLAYGSNYLYYLNKEYISPYFSANISVTKEIGDFASISFYANNFFNNLGEVHSSKNGYNYSVTNYVPSFFYGLSMRLKF